MSGSPLRITPDRVTIRPYQLADAKAVGCLIADSYREFNLSTLPPEQQKLYLGPFYFARSDDPAHEAAIAQRIQAPMVFVAEVDGEIAGVLRGRPGRLHSLFVSANHHGHGIGRALVTRFEEACRRKGATKITLASTLFAVPFYQRMGYKKSTGVRLPASSRTAGTGLGPAWQPMKKILA